MQWFKVPKKIYFEAGSIKYLEDMEKDPNYDGTTPLGLALDLESTLEMWN